MKRWCGCLLGLMGLTVAIICALPWWISPKQVETWVNRFLAPDYALQLPERWHLHLTGLQLPELDIRAGQCTLATFSDVRLHWWELRQLDVAHAGVDYDCLNRLPSSDETKTSTNLTALFSVLPSVEVNVQHFRLENSQALDVPPRVRALLDADIAATANYDGHRLQLTANAKTHDDHVILQHQSTLARLNHSFQWQGQTDYQPLNGQTYHLHFSTQLQEELSQLPQQGELRVDWQNADFSVNKGALQLSWNGEKGQINAQDLSRDKPLLDVPFTFTADGLAINWGTFYWTFDGYQPIKGFFGLALRKPQEGWLPLETDVDVIVQTFGELGKGEIVISGKKGEIGGGADKNQLNFDLKTRGDLRYNNTVAQTNLDYHISGVFEAPTLLFRPGSVFKMDNVQPDTKIHARLPLDNIQVGRYGLEGRLQATLQGFTPQFKQLNLKLDGQAHEFIAGIKTVFDLRDEKQNLRAAEMRAANRWDWTIDGEAHWTSLNTPVNIKGVGFWEADHIELNQLSAHSGNVHTGGVKMAPLALELKDRLRWDYEAAHLRGLLQAQTEWIEFAYGGRFVRPVFGVGIEGKSIDNFNLAGDLKAGALGPIDVTARYENQALNGNIRWQGQSAKVFQSLFPQQWSWIIRQGNIQGGSDFVINEDGVALQGEFNLRNVGITFPDGEIQALTIRFPINYQKLALRTARTKPIQVAARNIRVGALAIREAAFDVFGTYPNSAKQPLTLQKVKVGVFDGLLSVPSLSFPQRKIAVLRFDNIDLAQVMELAQYNQVSVSGRVNASLPFWLGHNACLICNGRLEQAGKLKIKLHDNMVSSLKKGGLTERMLVDLLKEMELEKSHANLNLTPDGNMTLGATITGLNPTRRPHHPITLNYTHQENMFELWDMVDYGSQFEQNLQYQLYRHLEQ